MSEAGPKKGGYKFDYATTNRAMCKGPKPCNGSKLEKGALRVGSVVEFRGHPNWSFRHYGCTTKKVFQNMKAAFSSPEEVEGFDTLQDADKEKIRIAWESEEVAPEDIPATAVAGAEDEDESKKKAGRPRKKQKTADDDDDEPKPKKKAAPRRKKKADSDDDADLTPSDDDAGSDYGGGKKRKRGGGAKRPKKKRGDDDD